MPGKRDSGSSVRYGHGPTKRVEVPTSLSPKGVGTTPGGSKPGGSGPVGKTPPSSVSSGKGVVSPGKGVQQKEWTPKGTKGSGSVRPDASTNKEILVASKLAGRATEIATKAAVGSIGGVAPGDYRGGLDLDDDWVCDPWGWDDCWDDWNCSWGWSWCGSWWTFPCYWSWYYPCWWWYTSPYYCYDYLYYPAVATVYYEPEVVYVERPPEGEPVGEAVATAPADQVRAPVQDGQLSPLSIAAQRYLELGDRAFREERYSDAVQFYAKAVEFAPDQGALYLVLADALFAAGDYHYGAYAIRRALELDPALVDSQVDKHGFYPDPARFDEQLAALERYLADHPSDRDARLMLEIGRAHV